MAARGTEHEREVARAKLEAMGASPPPPPPPTRNGAADAFDGWEWQEGPSGYRYRTPGQEMHFYGPNGEHIVVRGNFTVNYSYSGTSNTTSDLPPGW